MCLLYALILCLVISCTHRDTAIKSIYHFYKPAYDGMILVPVRDTLHFALREDVYTDIKSLNLFYQADIPFISFYDQRSQSINIYNFSTQQLCKRIKIKKIFRKHRLYKTSVYVKNFDSIYIVNDQQVVMCDSARKVKNKIRFRANIDNARAVLENNRPVFAKDQSTVYVMVRPNVNYKSKDALQEWKVMYEIDLAGNKTSLCYPLPNLYQANLYGYHFMNYNFCYNDKGRLIFSFPADTVLYETNLQDYNHSYFARSRYQKENIRPVSEESLRNGDELKEYVTRDSYGAVFYDAVNNYYLRLVKHRMSERDYLNKSQRRKESILIFDQQFKIIGESDWIEGADFDALVMTKDGKLFTRTAQSDENALHFVQLEYQKKPSLSNQITRK